MCRHHRRSLLRSGYVSPVRIAFGSGSRIFTQPAVKFVATKGQQTRLFTVRKFPTGPPQTSRASRTHVPEVGGTAPKPAGTLGTTRLPNLGLSANG